MTSFRTDHERRAYLLLHNVGLVTFDDSYGMAGSGLLNEWDGHGLVRITNTSAGVKIRTFKKYAIEAQGGLDASAEAS